MYLKNTNLVTSKALLYFSISIISLLLCFITTNKLRNLSFSTATVHNVKDEFIFSSPQDANSPFIQQSQDAQDLITFRNKISYLINNKPKDLHLLAQIRHWAREQQGNFDENKWKATNDDVENPLQALNYQHAGTSGACRRFAYILTGALTSAGYRSRIAHFASDFNDNTFNHTLVEVWVESLQKWILIDSDYDTFYLVDGKYASLLDMYRTVQAEEYHRITFERNGSKYKPIPNVYTENGVSNLVSSFKHIYISNTNAFFDGYRVRLFGSKRVSFFHFTEKETPPYPNILKTILYTSTALLCFISLTTFAMLLLTLRRLAERE